MALLAGELYATLGLDSKGYDSALDDAERRGNRSASAISGMFIKAGAAAAAGIGVAGIASAKFAIDFDSQMAEVRTLVPAIGDEAFGALTADVLAFSREIGIATSQAVPALYQAISAGVPSENVIEFMEVASRAAIGGVTDLETAVDGITSVTNAYGRENMAAARAADVMFTAVKLGKTDFTQLSGALFNVIPTAASLGIQFEEVAAALAVMTAQGVPTSVATTQLRQLMVEASKGGSKLEKAIRELTGKGLTELVAEGKTSAEVLDELRASLGDEEFRNVFGSVEALNAALAITGPNADGMASALGEMQSAAGAADQAFETVAESAQFKMGKALNVLKVRATEVGMRAIPLIASAADGLIRAMDKAGRMIDAVTSDFRRFAPAVAAAAAVIAVPLVLAFGAWAAAAIPAAVATLTALAPVLAIAAAVAGLAAGITWLVLNWNTVTDRVPIAGAALDKVREIVGAVGEWITGRLVPALAEAREKFTNDVLPAIENVASAFAFVGRAILDFITWAVQPLIAAARRIGEAFAQVFPAILAVVRSYLTVIMEVIEAAIEFIRDVISIGLALLRGDWAGAWEGVKTLLANVWESIKEITGASVDHVKNVIRLAWEAVKAGTSLVWDGIVGVVKGAINSIISMINAMFAALDKIEISIPSVSIPFGPTIPGFTIGIPSIPRIPMLARGGRGVGGLAIVGEAGPELVNLPRGSDVHSARDSARALGGSPVQVVINAPNYIGPEEMLAEPVKRVLAQFEARGVMRPVLN